MKKALLVFLLVSYFSAASFALSDFSTLSFDWDYFYLNFNIKGYPTYNKLFSRYDFYDLDNCYCGSLIYNTLVEAWEYVGL